MRSCPLNLSVTGVSNLLKGVGMGQETSRQQLRSALKRVAPEMTPNGPLNCTFMVPHVNPLKPSIAIAYMDPGAIATVFAQGTERFFGVLAAIHAQGSLVGLYLYIDGVTGGNILNAKHGKEAYCVYWSLSQFGGMVRREEWWFPLAVVRGDQVKEIEGGLSAVWAKILGIFFGERSKYRLTVWNRNGEALRFEAELAGNVQDEQAEQFISRSKGASGLKPCLKCQNVTSIRSGLAQRSAWLVDIAEHRTERLVLHTQATFCEVWDELERRKDQPHFADLEKRLGFSWHPEAAMALPWLRPALRLDQNITDGMHTLVASNGVFCSELVQLSEACKRVTQKRITLASIARFVDEGGWSTGGHIFTERLLNGSTSSGYFRGSASECLAIFRIVAFFCESILGAYPQLALHRASMMTLCWFMELILKPGIVWEHNRSSVATRTAVASRHLDLCKQAYGEDLRHKNHQEHHIAMQEDDAVNCFVGERKNKIYKAAVKNIAQPTSNNVPWSQHLMRRMVADQLGKLDAGPPDGTGLCDPREVPRGRELFREMSMEYAGLARLLCSGNGCAMGMPIKTGTVVMAGEEALMVELFCHVFHASGDEAVLLGKPLQLALYLDKNNVFI